MKQIYGIFLIVIIPSITFAQAYDDYIGTGHSQGITVTSSDPQSEGIRSIDGTGFEVDLQVASRFLAHATLGATIDDIKDLTEIGIESWIEDQMLIPPTQYTGETYKIILELYEKCMEQLGDACENEFVLNTYQWRFAWWDGLMKENDKLRQRVALALSEILVISDQSGLEANPLALSYYYDILMNHSFGNFHDLLLEVSLSPSMGFYLSHMNNPKSIPALNIHPDENYAREIMQLFSIGLYELHQDGARKVNMSTGEFIPTYDNDDIKELAKVFTGLSGSKWADDNITRPVEFGQAPRRYSYIDPMKMYDEWHEEGEKVIVGGHVIPAGQSGMEDVEDAVEHLFNHENVGPFLAIRLIQRLVKSNPSSEYIERIAGVFSNNGQGVRGDLAAVIKAILLDEEAIECYSIDYESNGMLRSPMLRYTDMMLSLQAEVRSESFWNAGLTFQQQTGQFVLSSPTVFNFYSPDYVPNDNFEMNGIVGPEFQILNSSTSPNYVNWMLLALNVDYFRDRFDFRYPYIINDSFFIPFIDNRQDYNATLMDPTWLKLKDSQDELLDYFDILLTNGQLTDASKESILDSLGDSEIFNPVEAANYALFMVMINPDYVIMK